MLTVQLANYGLYTFPNSVNNVPPGAALIANNGVIDRPNVFETRRGLHQYGTLLTTPINKLFSFQNRLISSHGDRKLAYDSDGVGTWADYSGNFFPVTGDRIRAVEANKDFFFTTSNGIYKIDTVTNSPYKSGGVPALDLVLSLTGATGFLATPSQCAYRITWIYTDSNGNLIEGNPSMATYISNNGGSTSNVSLTFTIPSEVSTVYSYRIYRTPQTNSLSITPGDTFQLAAQGNPTAGQIAAKSVTITDVTPDVLLGTTLYTSPGAQGEFQTNDRPPLAHDICQFLGMMFYANCSTLQQVYINLISVGAPNGIQNGDTVVINVNNLALTLLTYTGAAANNFPANQFKVDAGSSVSDGIDKTARNLVSAINQDPNNFYVYAFYVSGFNQLPGQILLQARDLTQPIFDTSSSRPAAFNPALSGVYASSNNSVLNGIFVSKLNEPEYVPAANLIFVGSGDQSIYRVYALRDAVIVEAQGGVFRITGTSPDTLVVTPFDNTVIQYGNDTGVTLNNSVFSFTTQGTISVTESGSQIVSRNVEGDLLRLSAPSNFPSFPTVAFAISYESDRKYILALLGKSTDTVSTQQYVYNWITQAWTTWDLRCTAGLVNPADNLLYIADDTGQVLQENKNFTLRDYADRQYSANLLSQNLYTITLDSVTNAVIGYSLAQNVTSNSVEISSVITAIDLVHKTVTVTDLINWYTGQPAGIYQPIDTTITYCPLTCGYPNFLKRFSPVIQFIFSQSFFENVTVGFTTDIYPNQESVVLTPKLSGQFGTFPFGKIPFGVSQVPLQMVNTYLTKNCTTSHWLNISVTMDQAFSNIALDGISGFYDILGERMK